MASSTLSARPCPATRKNPNQAPILNLLHVPARLLAPPKGDGSFSLVRSLRTVPIGKISLADMLANKYMSPLTLKDFEGYLVFREHAAENLYFSVWLSQYEKDYATYLRETPVPKTACPNLNTDPFAPRSPSHLPDHLHAAAVKAIETFFLPNSPLELNLPDTVRNAVLVDFGNTGEPKYLDPPKRIIDDSLFVSLNRYSQISVANAGPRRLVSCFCLGLFVFLLGLVPPIVAICTNTSRAVRVAGLPFIFLGASISCMALKRICAVIWLLGEDRQLLPWELFGPTCASGSLVPIESAPTSPSLEGRWDDSEKSVKSTTSATPYPWEKQRGSVPFPWETHDTPANSYVIEMAYNASEPHGSTRPPSYRSKVSTPSIDDTPVWGPVTRVYSSDVARAQYAIVLASFFVGACVLVAVGTTLMAVPNA